MQMSRVFVLIWVVMISASANAATDVGAPDSFWKGFSVNAVTAYVDYREAEVMTEIGLLEGVKISFYSQDETSKTTYLFDGEYLIGSLTYDGGDLFSGKRFQRRTSDSLFNLRGVIGVSLPLSKSWSWNPFGGLGYRLLSDKLEGSGSYLRQISYLYIPLGASFTAWLNNSWSIYFAADLDLVISGIVRNRLSDLDPSNSDLFLKNNGYGFRLVSALRADFGRFSLHLEPYYQRWTINESERQAVIINGSPGFIYEPKNTSDLIGLNLGVDF